MSLKKMLRILPAFMVLFFSFCFVVNAAVIKMGGDRPDLEYEIVPNDIIKPSERKGLFGKTEEIKGTTLRVKMVDEFPAICAHALREILAGTQIDKVDFYGSQSYRIIDNKKVGRAVFESTSDKFDSGDASSASIILGLGDWVNGKNLKYGKAISDSFILQTTKETKKNSAIDLEVFSEKDFPILQDLGNGLSEHRSHNVQHPESAKPFDFRAFVEEGDREKAEKERKEQEKQERMKMARMEQRKEEREKKRAKEEAWGKLTSTQQKAVSQIEQLRSEQFDLCGEIRDGKDRIQRNISRKQYRTFAEQEKDKAVVERKEERSKEIDTEVSRLTREHDLQEYLDLSV